MIGVDPEYVAARSVLLDALTALGPRLGSFVLVGAQGSTCTPARSLARGSTAPRPSPTSPTPRRPRGRPGSPRTADTRSYDIAVAGPAALLVAAVELEERHLAARAGGRNRVVTKDAVDCFHLLTTVETEDLVTGFGRHCDGARAETVSRRALTYLRDQHRQGGSDEIRTAIHTQLGDDVVAARWTALVEDLVDGCGHAGLI